MKKLELYLGLFRIPVDFVSTVTAFVLVYHLRLNNFFINLLGEVDKVSFYFEKDNFIFEYAVPMGFSIICFYAIYGLYTFKVKDSVVSQVGQVFVATILWLCLVITYFFIVRDFPFSRFVLLASTVVVFVFVSFGRVLINLVRIYYVKKGIGVKQVVLIVSNKKLLKKILTALKFDYRYKVVGYIAAQKLANLKLKYYGNLSRIEEVLSRGKFDGVIQLGEVDKIMNSQNMVDFCRYYHKEYQFVPEIYDVKKHNLCLAEIDGLPILQIKPTPLDGWSRVLKRIFDIVLSFIALILLAPFLALVALIIKIDSNGPIFFKYDDDRKIVWRIGQKGLKFYCLKFRTMQVGTHSMRYNELALHNIRKGSPLVKIENDPRITRVGQFLRRFDIDELPQLWNVFIGNMSFVGPRPHLVEEVDNYLKHQKFVLTVKPGITGMAQISGRSDLDFEDEIKLDTYYIENWSFWLDLKIILKTFFVIFKGHGEFNKPDS
jgi:exopolysaccharide biosynthesis polyprenyl glycosylphosphotransferase